MSIVLHNPILQTRYKGKFSKSVLQLEVVKARNLPKADEGPFGLSDPFCVLNINGVEHKTKVVTRSLNPVFNETFFFEDQLLGVWPTQTIEVKVFDFDIVSEPDLLGTVRVTLQDLLEKESENAELDAEEDAEEQREKAIAVSALLLQCLLLGIPASPIALPACLVVLC